MIVATVVIVAFRVAVIVVCAATGKIAAIVMECMASAATDAAVAFLAFVGEMPYTTVVSVVVVVVVVGGNCRQFDGLHKYVRSLVVVVLVVASVVAVAVAVVVSVVVVVVDGVGIPEGIWNVSGYRQNCAIVGFVVNS